MLMKDTDVIQDFTYSYQLLVIEAADQHLYMDKELTEVIGDVHDYNYKIVKVVTEIHHHGRKIVLAELSNILIGWFEVIDSQMLYNKKHEIVEIDLENYKSPEITMKMNDKVEYQLAFTKYTLTSRYFTFENGQRIEAIYRNKTFLAFCPSDVISRSINFEDVTSSLSLSLYDLYASPKKDDILMNIELDPSLPVDVLQGFPKKGMYKIRQGQIVAWVEEKVLPDIAGKYTEKQYTDQEMLDNHIIYTFVQERNAHRVIIKKLLNENVKLRDKVIKLNEKKNRIETLYENLKASKLGRIQIAIWERRRKGGRRK